MTDAGDTFRQNEILLTGGNGFLGKVLLGLLLDRYPQIKHLHLMLRPGHAATPRERLEKDVLESPPLAAVAANLGPEFSENKITVWAGDIGKADCALSAEDIARLKGRVQLIINCAGKVDFFPPVDDSFASNVDGVEHILALARTLDAKLLHVSTCFVSGEADGLVEESEPIAGFYPRRKGPRDQSFHHDQEIQYCRQQIRQIYESSENESGKSGRSRELRERLVELGRHRAVHWGWVNTYTYTKSLGEQLIAAESSVEWAIVRPAIVESSLRFPFPGWIEGGRTAAPLVLMALGGMKHWPVRRDTPLEVVPVDLVAAAIAAVGALLLDSRHERVYQLATADVHPIKLGPLVHLLAKESARRNRKNGLPFSLGARGGGAKFVSVDKMRNRRQRIEKRMRWIQSLLKGMLRVAGAARLPGGQALAAWTQKLRALELQAKFREQTLDQYLPFVLHNRYIFECENIRAAYSRLSPRDRQLLPWDPERIDWKKYWIDHQIEGIEKWVQPDAVRDWSFKI